MILNLISKFYATSKFHETNVKSEHITTPTGRKVENDDTSTNHDELPYFSSIFRCHWPFNVKYFMNSFRSKKGVTVTFNFGANSFCLKRLS